MNSPIMIDDSLWLCIDCTSVEVNGEYPEHDPDESQARRIDAGRAGIAAQGYLACNFGGASDADDPREDVGVDEFSWSRCDCCGTTLGGSRHRFALFAWGQE